MPHNAGALEKKMIKKAILVALSAAPICSFAATSVQMKCDQTVRDFFAPLIQGRIINPRPSSVQMHSLNIFNVRLLAKVDAYGMKVTQVVGFTDDPLLFTRNDPDTADVYGVVVRETIANAQAQLNSMGATSAKVFRLDAQSSAIICKGVI